MEGMVWWRALRFRTVLLLHMSLIVVAVVGATVLAITVVLGREARRDRSDDLVRARAGLAGWRERRDSLREAQVELVSRDPKLAPALVAEGIDRATVRDVAGELRRALRADRLIVVGGDGRLLADEGETGPARAGDPLLAAALDGKPGTAVWTDGGAAWRMYARPIEIGAAVRGAVVLGEAIDDELAAELGRETGDQVVIAAAGRAVASSPPRGAGELAELTRATALATAPVELTIAGERVLAVGAPFAPGLEASLVRSLEPALAARERLTWVVAAIAISALLLSLLLAAAGARRLAAPLDALAAFTRRVADGHLEERVAAGGAVEVRALADAMNEMTSRLDQSHGKLVLADRLASVGTLAAGVAHEINNPLTYVVGNLEMLELDLKDVEAELPEGRLGEAREMMKDTRDGVDRVRDIVRDLKVFSRAGVDEIGPVDVGRVVDLACNMTRHEIRPRARLAKDVGEVPAVAANEGRLGQVLVNLLVNAAHAIPEGNVKGNEIVVAARRLEDGRVRIEVRDTGIGIPPEIRRRIFDPFFTTKEIGVGTGLGLSICHAIVAGLGGEMTVDSEVGKGSVFGIVLPAATPAVPAFRSAPSARRAVRRGRVLVVDDEPMLAKLLERALADEHDVTTVSDGSQALEQLDGDPGSRFDVVLCDLMMPRLTGMDLYDEIVRRAPAFAQRFIFITGGAFTPRARKFVEEVPNDCLEKPLDMAALREVIQKRVLDLQAMGR